MTNQSITLPTILLVLACLGLSTGAQAVSPAPDGGYPGGNTAEGQNALLSLTTGTYNTAVGFLALTNNNAQFNTAVGAGALLASTGDENTALGAGALLSNTTGEGNTATGEFTLFRNIDGANNTANGAFAIFSNTTGVNNTAIGSSALFSNIEGGYNTAVGFEALTMNTTGVGNTATGEEALSSNIDGGNNTANGNGTLFSNINGSSNTAVGDSALEFSTGSGNTAIGHGAGISVTTASNIICIGSSGQNIDNSCFIDNIYSNIQPVVGIDPDYVTVASNGRLGRSNLNGSSRRFKHDIKPMDKASEVIFAFKPASFRYNKDYDATQRLSFGLIAEEVAEVAPDLVGRNKHGEPDSVRYEQINAMLLNEFIKEHRKVEKQNGELEKQARKIQEQETTLTELKKEIRTVVGRLNGHDSTIQKASAQSESNRPPSQQLALKIP